MNLFDTQPTTIDDCADLTDRLCSALKLGKYHACGHSMGGAVAYTLASNSSDVLDASGFAPLLPTDHGLFGYLLRALKLQKNELTGMLSDDKEINEEIKEWSTEVRKAFISNFLKNPFKSFATLCNISNYMYGNVSTDWNFR